MTNVSKNFENKIIKRDLKLALSILPSYWLCIEEMIEFDDCCRQLH